MTVRPSLARGALVGRYVILDPVARAGTGMAYQAYDPELNRRLVLRFLDVDELHARALARLAHPNVIAVYDIGTLDGHTFITMEHVEGRPLPAWLAGGKRSRREIVEVFTGIARGLAAAHRIGIVHGGFAPLSVVVGEDGRVRVAELGLRGGAGDAADDQYRFCIALFEALVGTHPFPDGQPDPHRLAAGRVPAWLRRILARGLGPDPAQRYPSMDDLVAELSRDSGARQRSILGLAAALVLGVAAVFGIARQRVLATRACQDNTRFLAGVWDDSMREKLRAAFVSAGRPNAADSYQRVARVLDEYAARWSSLRTQTCEAARTRGEESERMLDRGMACLRKRLSALEALTAVLTEKPDGDVLDNAISAAVGLPSLSSCADREALLAAFPPPADPQLRARVESLDKTLDRAQALRSAGKYPSAIELAKDVSGKAHALDYPRLTAKAALLLGELQDDLGDAKTAEKTLVEALQTASSAKDDLLVARTWVELTWTVGYSEARRDEAIELAPAAEAAIVRAGGDRETFANLQNHLGVVYWAAERIEDARKCHERALAIREQLYGPDHAIVSKSLTNLGNVYYVQHENDRAAPYYQRALAITERVLGPDHPDVARAHANLGANLLDQGNYIEARRELERALQIYQDALGPAHLWVGMVSADLGKTVLADGHARDAIPYLERALPILEKAFGPNDPNLAGVLTTLADSLVTADRAAEAMPLLARALRIRSGKETKPSERATTQFVLARALFSAHREHARALALAREAEQALAASGKEDEKEHQKVTVWLAAHRTPE